MEHVAFPKIPRLNRPITVTEKLDGTNSAVVIEEVESLLSQDSESVPVEHDDRKFLVYAQSRKRIITPKEDNHGFAAWVWVNAAELVKVLGPGRHYGEWYGSGINRGYGLPKGEKRFSLFNTRRWDVLSEHSEDQPLGVLEDWTDVPGLRVVPTITQFETFDTEGIKLALQTLRDSGSFAAPGFMNPEGVVIYHRAANSLFKVTLEGDEAPKSLVNPKKVVFQRPVSTELYEQIELDSAAVDHLARGALQEAMERRA